jgi:hydrogenase maturation protein HypF
MVAYPEFMKSVATPTLSQIISITGLVQGVGFRPFIYRLAHIHGVSGHVSNNLQGVTIRAEGTKKQLVTFINDIRQQAPPAAAIDNIKVVEMPVESFYNFEILHSTDSSSGITEVSPDIAVCDDCLHDMKHQPHRLDYPFSNCTNCGPRFSIISDLPYDREKTAMQPFEMCPQCRSEYIDVLNRRFHAQPVACNHCGPKYQLIENGQSTTGISSILKRTVELVQQGKIIAVKGMGGFHLMCDATNETAVANLRRRKLREGKPFAVMFGRLDSIQRFAEISAAEEQWLASWQRPIVLLRSKLPLASSVTNGFKNVGVMLPYMPIHHQLFELLHTPAVVLTSGNLSDEPIILENDIALSRLKSIADAFLIYNRNIINRTDDSVGLVVREKPMLLRRSRGYAPTPIRTNLNTDSLLATGAELVNCFAVGKDKLAIMSQHIGDLKNYETNEFFEETITKFQKLFRVKPEAVAVDMHPDYLSTRYGKSLGIQVVEVQHHHAHIAACMAEHKIDEPVIGISMDGTGYGTDGNIWGGEFMICDLKEYERFSHFGYVAMPGGDLVTKAPWRSALSYLMAAFGHDVDLSAFNFLKNIASAEIELVREAIIKNINAPLSSSCGRLFDAVSALTGICTHAGFHAEAPMRLQDAVQENISESYPFINKKVIDFSPMIRAIADDLNKKTVVGAIAAKFHNTVEEAIVQTAVKMRRQSNLQKVVLSGGSFQNVILLERSIEKLQAEDFEVFWHQLIPANDGGIALGQLAIAAKRLRG